MESQDGLRTYRPPTYTPRLGNYQADRSWRNPSGRTNQMAGNSHLGITEPSR